MHGNRYTDELELEVLTVAPMVEVCGMRLGPDEVIALEGLGTFDSVSVRRRAEKALAKGKDVSAMARGIHRESTRRGHASLTTSLGIFYEVRECSRALSLLLVSSPFGSHLQESQRRVEITRERMLLPAELRNRREGERFRKVIDKVFYFYKGLIKDGVDKQDARYVLPLASPTSLFSSITFETYSYIFRRASDGDAYLPTEFRVWSERFIEEVRLRSPAIVEARLGFLGDTNYYPFPDPFRPADDLARRILGGADLDDARLISLDIHDFVREVLESGNVAELNELNPLVNAKFAEALSLVAYHQAIRHRTIPTAIESIHDAAARALKEQSSLVVPPSIRVKESLNSSFREECIRLLELYEELVDEGQLAASIYAVPQSTKIIAIRVYNLFNLLYPMGFVATRTCSYAQWEERAVAYKIWREVEREAPWLGSRMGEKCRHLGYCPERAWCPIILRYHQYDDELHKRYNE